jgi:isopenicillin N synthase-like dioxygenase
MLERIAQACSTCGVFYVENHGVPEELLRRALGHFDAFFDLPLEERMEIVVPAGQACGYEPLDEARELNDSFHCVFGMEEFPELEALLNTGPNRWPRRPEGLEAVVRETMHALYRLGSEVMSSLALSLGLPADHFDPIIGSCHGSVRARRYPPQRQCTDRVGTNAHVDGLPLAFIIQNDVPGLQTEIPGEGWAAVEPRPGTIVCQLGSLFSRWTNDRYVANRHRVVNEDPTRERRSIIYWFPIDPHATIECLPTCHGAGDPPRHAPIRYTDYITQWVRSFADEA